MNDTRNSGFRLSQLSTYRVWLRMEGGGMLGLPYPAANDLRAQYLATKAGECFGGEVVEVEYLGEWMPE